MGALVLFFFVLCLFTLSLKTALLTIAGIVSVWFALVCLQGLYFDFRYRDELRACLDAVRTDNVDMADSVNQWTTHFYVHKGFYARANDDGIKVGYRLSVRERIRNADWGGWDGGYMGF